MLLRNGNGFFTQALCVFTPSVLTVIVSPEKVLMEKETILFSEMRISKSIQILTYACCLKTTPSNLCFFSRCPGQ